MELLANNIFLFPIILGAFSLLSSSSEVREYFTNNNFSNEDKFNWPKFLVVSYVEGFFGYFAAETIVRSVSGNKMKYWEAGEFFWFFVVGIIISVFVSVGIEKVPPFLKGLGPDSEGTKNQ